MTADTRYELTGRVAVSATATVWKAQDLRLDRVVAIKALHPELAERADLRDRLREEARVLGGITDPHVVAVYDFVEREDDVWLVEEWIEGATLRRVRDTAGRLSAEQAVGVVRGALLGLATVHGLGLVHRDVAPSNILVSLAGESKLADFGLAAPVGSSGAAGTPAYMSPEAVRSGRLTTASDVYSAAAVLASLLTGHDVFAGSDVDEVLRRHLDPRRPGLTELTPRLRDVLGTSLAIEPDNRPPDAAALLALLEEAARDDLGAGWLARAGVASLLSAAMGTAGLQTAKATLRHSVRHRPRLSALSAKPVIATVAGLAVAGTVAGVVISNASSGHRVSAQPPPTSAAGPAVVPTSAAAPVPSAVASFVVPVAMVPASALATSAVATTSATGIVTVTGKITSEVSKSHTVGNAKVHCIELQTTAERYFLNTAASSGYTTITSEGFGGAFNPAASGITTAGDHGPSVRAKFPIGATVTVTAQLLNFRSDNNDGCPLHRGLILHKIGKAKG
ncbi:MAG: eukaryotic-like serine/threonine-protein kinase [Frankiales bacterium]|jgi:serine/threonine-protein kinase|nr:eukaryotic-like serine/threonine-protein kinase [Frankiales bacterium]